MQRTSSRSSASSSLLLAVTIVALTCFFNHLNVFLSWPTTGLTRVLTCIGGLYTRRWLSIRGELHGELFHNITWKRSRVNGVRVACGASFITAINHIIDSLLLGKPPQDWGAPTLKFCRTHDPAQICSVAPDLGSPAAAERLWNAHLFLMGSRHNLCRFLSLCFNSF